MKIKNLLANLSNSCSYTVTNKEFNDWWKETLDILENDCGTECADSLYENERDFTYVLTILYLHQKGKLTDEQVLEEIGEFESENTQFKDLLNPSGIMRK